jgi:capsular polysaccharide biosynthesis protein
MGTQPTKTNHTNGDGTPEEVLVSARQSVLSENDSSSSSPPPRNVTTAPGHAPAFAVEDDAPRGPVPSPATASVDVDRIAAIWRARRPIAIATAAVAIVVFLIGSLVPAVYSSSSTLSITASSTPGGSAQDVALASNDFAAQDAQLVLTDGVLDPVAKQLGVSSSTLGAHISAGTLAAQNLVQITAQSGNAHTAQQWAQATATGFQRYLVARSKANSAALQQSVQQETVSLDNEIFLLQSEIAAAKGAVPGSEEVAQVQGLENQLTSLTSSRATLTANTAIAMASQQPNVAIVVSGTAPTKVSPRPTLYALIGALVTFLIACQLAVVAARRRTVRVEGH